MKGLELISLVVATGVFGYTIKNHKKWKAEIKKINAKRRYNVLRPIIRANYHASLKTPGGEYFESLEN